MSSEHILVADLLPTFAIMHFERKNDAGSFQLVEVFSQLAEDDAQVGDIFLGKVSRVISGLQAAFIDIDDQKHGFLHISDMPTDAPHKAKIQSLLSEGQNILVQVLKNKRKDKGPQLSTNITLPGHNVIFLPQSKQHSVSKKISLTPLMQEKFAKLKEKLEEAEFGFILRTASEGINVSVADIEKELLNLKKTWDGIVNLSKKEIPPKRLYRDAGLVEQFLRNHPKFVIKKLFLSPELNKIREEYFDNTLTSKLVSEGISLVVDEEFYDTLHVKEQIASALRKKVKLPSGGFLVIEPTEAMVVIDINTGGFIGHKNFEQTVMQTNLEACQEIARQVILRNLSGIIVIDFIDSIDPQNKLKVIDTLKDAFKDDPIFHEIFSMSALGLVEMTRKRVGRSLYEVF